MSIDIESDQLTQIPLLRGVELSRRKLIVMSSDHLNYKAGDMVFRQGDPANAVYLMLSGSVRVVADDGERAIELAHIQGAAILGETGVLCGRNRTASIFVTSDTRMLRIDGRVFAELLEQVPSLSIGLLKEMAQRLDAANRRLLQVTGHLN